MAATKHAAFRLAPELIAKLDREVKRVSRETGLDISRSDIILIIGFLLCCLVVGLILFWVVVKAFLLM